MKPVDFGDYKLVKKLATGGMGEVFLAKQEQGAGFERYVAIKRILPELSGDDEFVRMFLDEARLAARLNHPNVAQIYDLGICGEQYYLAMEFLEGRDLRRVMGRLGTKDRALPGAHAVQIIHGAAEGLFYAHELKDAYGSPLNIIHRDVSPQNIFVSFHGTIKVLDFGIAKAEARSVRTKTGGLKGKYPYLSPEQVKGAEVDSRSDVFSLGTVLWEITVGRRLFKRDNDLLTLQAVLQCEVTRPSELMNNYPPELEVIVMKALASDPDKRYSTCRALQEDLEQFVGQYGLVLSPQKLGKFVKNLFSNETQTVTDIVESLKKKPKSQSLLHDEASEGSESFSSRSFVPPLGRDELTEPSGSAIDQDLIRRLAMSEHTSNEGSDSSHPSMPSNVPGQRSMSADHSTPSKEKGASLGLVDMFAEIGALSSSSASQAPDPVPTPIWTPRAFEIPARESSEDIPLIDIEPDFDLDATHEISNSEELQLIDVEPDDELATTMELQEAQEETLAIVAPEVDPARAQAIARAPTALAGLPMAQPSGDDTGETTEEPPPIALASTMVHGVPAAAPLQDSAPTVTPSKGTDLPPSHPGVSSDSLEAIREATLEMPSEAPRTARTADLLSIVRQWPKATLTAVIAAVVLPFVLVVSLVVIVENGAPPSSEPSQGTTDAGATPSTTDTGLFSSLTPPPPEGGDEPPLPLHSADSGETLYDVGPVLPPDLGQSIDASPDAGASRADAGASRADAGASRADAEALLPSTSVPDEPSQAGSQPQMARLTVTTSPSGLRVLIGGRSIGSSPVSASLLPGAHRVTVRGSGYEHSVNVRLRPGDRRTERITVPRGTLALVIRPYADVFIDGRHVGLTPMPPVQLTPGRHRVRLVNNSLNRSVLRTVTIRPGRRSTLSVNMSE